MLGLLRLRIVLVIVAMSVVVMSKIIGNISIANGTSIVVPIVTKNRLKNKPLKAFNSSII